jgi:uncharacterized protein YcfL
MRKIVVFVIIALFFVSCTSTKNTISKDVDQSQTAENSQQDGSSFENAIVINKTSSSEGIEAEYAYLRKHYQGYKLIMQSLQSHKSKAYDVLKKSRQLKAKKLRCILIFQIFTESGSIIINNLLLKEKK